jgi:hypothetical protein
MAEPSGDRDEVVASGQKGRCYDVSKIVKTNVLQASAISGSSERRRDCIWVHRFPARRVVGEDVALPVECQPRLPGPSLSALSVEDERRERRFVNRHPSDAVGLGISDLDAMTGTPLG